MGLQPLHQVLADELLLHGDALVVDNVCEQPESLPAEVEVVGGEQGGEDCREVGVPEKTEAHCDTVGARCRLARILTTGVRSFTNGLL